MPKESNRDILQVQNSQSTPVVSCRHYPDPDSLMSLLTRIQQIFTILLRPSTVTYVDPYQHSSRSGSRHQTNASLSNISEMSISTMMIGVPQLSQRQSTWLHYSALGPSSDTNRGIGQEHKKSGDSRAY